MAEISDYQDIVAPKEDPNPYSEIVQSKMDEQRQGLQESMYAASTQDPDQAAAAQQLAAKVNLPPDLVARNYDDVAAKHLIASTDYDAIVKESPKTADWASNPDNAAVAKNDIDSLRKTEDQVNEYGLLRSAYQSLGSGLSQMYSSLAKIPALAYDTAALPQNLAADAFDLPGLRTRSPEWLGDNGITSFWDQQAKDLSVPELSQSALTHAANGDFAKAGRTAFLQFMQNAPSQAVLLASYYTGFGTAGLALSGAETAANANIADRESGATPGEVTSGALLKGTIESAFESLGTFGVLHQWENTISKNVGKAASKEVFKDFFKTLLYSGAAEGNEEFLTSGAQDLTDYITGVNKNVFSEKTPVNIPSTIMWEGQEIQIPSSLLHAADAGLQGAAAGLAMTGPTAVTSAAARGHQVRQAQLTKDFYTAMGTSAEANALRERMPEAHKDFINSVVNGTGVENLFISPEAIDTYFQDSKQNPVQAMQAIGALDEYTKAKEAGTDVQIPLATWIDKVVGTEHYAGLANDIKFSPEDQSVNEAKAAQDETKAQVEAAAKEAESATAPAAAAEQSAQAVGNTISEQLKAVGQDPQQAIVYEKMFQTLGQRMGVDPQDLFNQYVAHVQGPKPGTAVDENGKTVTLNQDGTYGPLAPHEEIAQLRSRVAELENESRISPVTGLRNAKAFDEDANLGWQTVSAMDMDGLKRLNDTAGHENADKVLKALGGALLKAQGDSESVRFYHRSGDEFAGRFKTSEDAQAFMSKLQDDLNNVDVEIYEDGVHKYTYEGIGLSFGVGENYEKADIATNEQKQERLKAGKREDARATGAPRRLIKVADLQTGEQGRDSSGQPQNPDVKPKVLNQGPNENSGPRAQIDISPSQAIIRLGKAADASSFFHESGHYFLEVLGNQAAKVDAPERVKADYQALLDWLGVKSRDEIGTQQHEQFARGFEAYIMEGKAPSNALREAFTRFRIWLTSVYKQLKNLNVTLTPEVRGVMDRLLATDEEIEQATRNQGLAPLFQDPSKFGLTGEKAIRYEKAIADARDAAEAELTKKVMGEYMREKDAAWRDERNALKESFAKEVNQRPVYIADSVMRKGVMPDGSALAPGVEQVKFAYSELTEKQRRQVPRGTITRDASGVHPDIAASFFGFNSGLELIEALSTAPKREELINQMADDAMHEKHGDIMKDQGALQAEAMNAVHNDKQAELMRLELEHLASENIPTLKDVIRQVTKRVPTTKEVRQRAQETIGSNIVRDIKPALYQRAGIKAAKQAGEALAKGDFRGAYDAKLKELFNHELYRAAVAAQADVTKSLQRFKKTAQPDEKIAKTRDMDLVNAARAVLAQFQIGKADTDAMSYLEPLKRYDLDTYETMKSLVDASTQNPGDFKAVPYNDFVDMRNTVDALWDLARSSKQMVIDGQKVDRAEAIGELNIGISERSKPGSKSEYRQTASKWDQTKLFLMGARAALRRVESWVDSMDGGDPNGAFRRILYNPIIEATGKYRLAKNDYLKKYLELLRPIEKTLTQEEIASPELGFKFKGKAQLLGALLHTGNQSNLQKLLRGWGWGGVDADGNLDTTKWDAFLSRMYKEGTVTKADMDFAQSIWDLMEELKPGAQAAHKAMYGYYFNEITAQPVVTPFGTFRGGYVPARVDPFHANDAAMRSDKEALENSNNSYAFPTTGKGATKSRVEQYAAPLQFDLRFIAQHIDWALRFANIEPAVKNAARIVMNKEFRNNMDTLDPAIVGDALVPWLQRAATQSASGSTQGWSGKGVDRFFSAARRNVGMNIMVGNVTNAAQQLTGLAISAVKVKPKHLRDGLLAYMKDPKGTAQYINEQSEFMRTRTATQIMDINQNISDILLDPSKIQKAQQFILKHGYFLQTATQNVVDITTWTGAYNQAIENGAEGLSAVREADAAVRLTQGSFNPEDISRAETGTPFQRMFTMFYGYFNMQANLLGTEFANSWRDMGLRKGAGRGLYVYTFGFMIPAVLAELITKAMSGKFDEDDDDSYVNDFLNAFFGGQTRTATAMVPFVGSAVQTGFNRWNNKAYDDHITVSPAIATLESLVGSSYTVYKAIAEDGNKKRAVRDALSAVGLLSGIPVQPLSKPLGYLSDVNDGTVRPAGPLDYTRGLITGKAGAGQ